MRLKQTFDDDDNMGLTPVDDSLMEGVEVAGEFEDGFDIEHPDVDPALHLPKPLSAELCLTSQRLLGDQRVRAGRAGMDLIINKMMELEIIHIADSDCLMGVRSTSCSTRWAFRPV